MAFSLKQLINEYVHEHNHKFTVEEIHGYAEQRLEEKIPLLQVRLMNLLADCPLVFYNEEKCVYIPRSVYFQNSRFLICPTSEEIEAGILIPGHRFLPFCNLGHFPAHYTLLEHNDHRIVTRKFKKKIEELFIYTNLLDLFTLPDYLVYDEPSNAELFRDGEFNQKHALLTVFDMKDFYTRFNWQEGDGLVLEVLDWENCVYKISYSSVAERSGKTRTIRKWIQLMDDSFDDLFVEEGLHIGIEEQIARAYFRAGDFILSHPCLHLGGYLSRSELITILPMGERHVLWYINEPPGPEDFIRLEELSGTVESLDEILKDINCPVSGAEVEAFMRDEFFRRDPQYKNVIESCFGGTTLHFFDKYQERKCYQFIKDLWERIGTEYNFFTDQVRGGIRQKGLRILQSFNHRFKELENQYAATQQEISPEDIFEVTRILNSIFSILRLCNEESRLVDEEQDKLEKALFSLETEVQWILQEVEHKLKPRLSLVKDERGEAAASENIFVLKVTLKYLRPPIWRRIRVPGHCTLGKLHVIIQKAFGWEDDHPHEFVIDDTVYGEVFSDQSPDVVDEFLVPIGSVLEYERQKFSYLYDFGDNWELQIEVEKISPSGELSLKERKEIVCLAGRRAAPPENCGGVGVYQLIQEVLKTKKEPEYSELKERIPPDFDTEMIDLVKINHFLKD